MMAPRTASNPNSRLATWTERLGGAVLPTFVGIGIIGFVARLAYSRLIAPRAPLGLDSVWYLLVGSGLADGNGYSDPTTLLREGQLQFTANFPPLYPGVIGLARLVGIDSDESLRVLGAAIGSATVILTGLIGLHLAGRRVGLLAAVGAALWPGLISSDGALMSETVFVPLMTIGFLATLWACRNAKALVPWVLAGMAFGVATLARTDGLVLAVFVAIGAALSTRHIRGPLVLVALTLACLLPWSIYASARLNTVVATSTATSKTLAGAACDEVFSGPDIGGWDVACVDRHRPPGNDEAERTRSLGSAAIDYTTSNLTRLPAVLTARAARTMGLWKPQVLADAEVEESRVRDWQYLAWVAWLAVAAAVPFGLWCKRQAGLPMALLIAFLLGPVVLAMAAWGNQRFRLGVEPVAIVCAAMAADTTLTQLARSIGR